MACNGWLDAEYPRGIDICTESSSYRAVEYYGDDIARARSVSGRVTQHVKATILRPERCRSEDQREDAQMGFHCDRAERVT